MKSWDCLFYKTQPHTHCPIGVWKGDVENMDCPPDCPLVVLSEKVTGAYGLTKVAMIRITETEDRVEKQQKEIDELSDSNRRILKSISSTEKILARHERQLEQQQEEIDAIREYLKLPKIEF